MLIYLEDLLNQIFGLFTQIGFKLNLAFLDSIIEFLVVISLKD